MATNIQSTGANGKPPVLVRATVILRIPDLDTQEITELYEMLGKITERFGGEYDVNTAIQPPATTQ